MKILGALAFLLVLAAAAPMWPREVGQIWLLVLAIILYMGSGNIWRRRR